MIKWNVNKYQILLKSFLYTDVSQYYESQAKQETADIMTQQYYEKDYAKLKKLFDENCREDEFLNHKTVTKFIIFIILTLLKK